jgi:hypothetical protein
MCSVIVYFLHYICVCDCDGRHESLIMLSHSVMVRRYHLLARCYLGTMCMCTTFFSVVSIQICSITSANPSFYIKYVENDYFSLLSKFKMYFQVKYTTTKSLSTFCIDANGLLYVPMRHFSREIHFF